MFQTNRWIKIEEEFPEVSRDMTTGAVSYYTILVDWETNKFDENGKKIRIFAFAQAYYDDDRKKHIWYLDQMPEYYSCDKFKWSGENYSPTRFMILE